MIKNIANVICGIPQNSSSSVSHIKMHHKNHISRVISCCTQYFGSVWSCPVVVAWRLADVLLFAKLSQQVVSTFFLRQIPDHLPVLLVDESLNGGAPVGTKEYLEVKSDLFQVELDVEEGSNSSSDESEVSWSEEDESYVSSSSCASTLSDVSSSDRSDKSLSASRANVLSERERESAC